MIINPDWVNYKINSAYRFYGNGLAAIDDIRGLMNALAFYRTTAKETDTVALIPEDIFVLAFANMLHDGDKDCIKFLRCMWYPFETPVHNAGNEVDCDCDDNQFIVEGVRFNGAQITALTLKKRVQKDDALIVKRWDRFQFVDGTAGFEKHLRYPQNSGRPMQCMVLDNAFSVGDKVMIEIYPALPFAHEEVIGRKVEFLPSCRLGLIASESMLCDPMVIAFPLLQEQYMPIKD